MEITVAKSAGFCFGVDRAVKLTECVAAKGAACTLGEIIHNPSVVEKLKKKGVGIINSLDDYKEGTVVIRSHGAAPGVFEELTNRGIKYADATCPFVSRIHKIVKKCGERGEKIIIVGEASHPEVIGINGWCGNSATILSDENFIIEDDGTRSAVVVQTTFSSEKFKKICRKLKNIVNLLDIYDTICYTTKDRQEEALVLSKKCDAIYVIGGGNSSNTRKLYDICKVNCRRTYLIESVADLKPAVVKNITRLGITAGASTPKELIMEVVTIMSDTQNKVGNTPDEETVSVDTATQEIVNENVENTGVNPGECASLSLECAEPANEESAAETEPVAEEKAADEVKKTAKSKDAAVEIAKTEFELLFEASEKENSGIKAGKKIKGVIMAVNDDGIVVNINQKKDGFIDKSEVELDDVAYVPDNYKVGSEISAIIIEKKSKKTDYISMSKKMVDLKKAEQVKYEQMLRGSDFTVTIEKAVKGGLMSKLGPYNIFIPAAQIKIGYASDLEKYVGTQMKVRMIPGKKGESAEGEEPRDIKINNKRVVASHKVILEEEKKEKEDAHWEKMFVGNVVKGKVKRFTEFGAFVSVDGFDCLAHISDLSWYKIDSPSEIFEINKSYEFVVLRADREQDRVSLGYKQLQKKPYETAKEIYPVDTVVKGKIERIFDYGAFVSIEKGVDGLVPVSEISHEYVKDPRSMLTEGQEVEAKVIKFEGSKITLSIKALLPLPEVKTLDSIELTDEEIEANKEKRAKANYKKFENTAQQSSAPRKPRSRRPDKSEENEIKEWSTESSSVTFADLFKGIKFNVAEDTETSEDITETEEK